MKFSICLPVSLQVGPLFGTLPPSVCISGPRPLAPGQKDTHAGQGDGGQDTLAVHTDYRGQQRVLSFGTLQNCNRILRLCDIRPPPEHGPVFWSTSGCQSADAPCKMLFRSVGTRGVGNQVVGKLANHSDAQVLEVRP
jgi:hypothetical protein